MRLVRGLLPLAASVCVAAGGTESNRVVRDISVIVIPPETELKPGPGFAVGDTVEPDRVLDGAAVIRGQFQDSGFLWAAVDVDTSSDSAGISVKYVVNRGSRARVGGWVLVGEDSLAPERLQRYLPRSGARFDHRTTAEAANILLARLEELGFALAAVRPVAVAESGDRVFPTLAVDRGPRVRVSFLEFRGRLGTRAGLLARFARFRSADFSRANLGTWRRNIERSGLVRVDSQVLVRRDSDFGVQFWLTGERSNQAGAMVGYLPDDRSFTGFVRLNLRNLFDTGRRLEAGWQSASGRTSYSLGYTEPWVLGSGFDISGSARQQVTDTTYSQTNLALSGVTATATAATLSLETGWDRFTDVLDRTWVQVTWAGTGFGFDTRDFPANPRRGFRFDVGTRAGTRATDSGSAKIVSRSELGFAITLPAGPRLVWTSALAAWFTYSPAVLTEPELYRMGGPGTLRGYREDEFGAARLGWGSSELRLLPDRQSRLYPFLDAGAFSDSLGWHLKPAYGIGARVATRAGVLGVDYGVAFQDSPLRGKVHLSFDATF